MSSVSKRIDQIKQPRGGYVNLRQFEKRKIDDGKILVDQENVHGSIVGMAVEYMTHYMMGASIEQAFYISLTGADRAKGFGNTSAVHDAYNYIEQIKGLDDQSLINACKLVTFDVWYRSPIEAMHAKTAEDTNPDAGTINNIRIMIERSIEFWREYGPIVLEGFDFHPNGYTKTITIGDADFLTKDTLWDYKVLKKTPQPKDTLQILVYWVMGQHSGKKEFKNVNKIGIFNPRHNCVYTLCVDTIPSEIIRTIETDVIGYC